MRSILPQPTPLHIAPWTTQYNAGFIGGFYIRPFGPLAKGAFIDGHEHYIDHMTFIEAGSVLIEWTSRDGRSGAVIVDAPNFIEVKAASTHKVTALADGTRWRCMFAAAEAEKLAETEGPIPYNMARPNV